MGPTELLPGSHFLYANASLLGHYDQIRGTFKAMGPAGSIYMDVYNIWHRRMPSTAWGRRDMLKYTCWRTSPPERDWLAAPDFDVATADYRIPEIPVRYRNTRLLRKRPNVLLADGKGRRSACRGGTLVAYVRGFRGKALLGP